MKKWRSILLLFALALCFTCAYPTSTEAAVRLNKASLSLVEGKSATLKVTGTKKKVKWKSSNKTIATVTSKGKVTAKAPGEAVISATVGKTTKKCQVTVSVDYAKTYEYQIKYGKVTINKLLRISESDLVIPDQIEGCPVTELTDGLFRNCEGLERITLPSNVTRIGDSAFYGCHTLREIICKGRITSLGSYAFYECRALETLPDLSAIESIGEYAFYDCDALTSFSSVPLSLKSIGNYAFYDCDKLLTFFVPELLVSVGDCAFKSCDKLMTVSGFKNVQTVGSECFADCAQLGAISLGSKVTTLGAGCFSGCEKLGSVSLPVTLTAIPDRCFYNCYAISNITLPTGVTKIGNMAFFNCIRLSILTIPGTGIASIASDSFAGVPLNNLSIYYRTSTYMEDWLKKPENSGIQKHTI